MPKTFTLDDFLAQFKVEDPSAYDYWKDQSVKQCETCQYSFAAHNVGPQHPKIKCRKFTGELVTPRGN